MGTAHVDEISVMGPAVHADGDGTGDNPLLRAENQLYLLTAVTYNRTQYHRYAIDATQDGRATERPVAAQLARARVVYTALEARTARSAVRV